MNPNIQNMLKQCYDERLDGRHTDQEQLAELIIQACIDVIEDLKGYSGVDVYGQTIDTGSWNAAGQAAIATIRYRLSS